MQLRYASTDLGGIVFSIAVSLAAAINVDKARKGPAQAVYIVTV